MAVGKAVQHSQEPHFYTCKTANTVNKNRKERKEERKKGGEKLIIDTSRRGIPIPLRISLPSLRSNQPETFFNQIKIINLPKFIREYKTNLFKTFIFCSKSSLARLIIKNSSAIDPPHKGSIFFPFVKRDSSLFLYFQKKERKRKIAIIRFFQKRSLSKSVVRGISTDEKKTKKRKKSELKNR